MSAQWRVILYDGVFFDGSFHKSWFSLTNQSSIVRCCHGALSIVAHDESEVWRSATIDLTRYPPFGHVQAATPPTPTVNLMACHLVHIVYTFFILTQSHRHRWSSTQVALYPHGLCYLHYPDPDPDYPHFMVANVGNFIDIRSSESQRYLCLKGEDVVWWVLHIKLEGPEDPHLRNPRFRRSCDPAHASIPLAQTPWGLTGRAWL